MLLRSLQGSLKRGSVSAEMPHYIALIHKDTDSCYGVSFPGVPGVFAAGDRIESGVRAED
jgi:hypothetical protein